MGGRCPRCMLRLALGGAEADDASDLESESAKGIRSEERYFGGYELVDELASGGMGVVFKARQLGVNRWVALKRIHAAQLESAETRLRFRLEVEAIAQLNHPNIVSLYETGEVDGTHFYTMSLIEGCNLAELLGTLSGSSGAQLKAAMTPLLATIQRESPLRWLVRLLVKVSRAVHYAHQRGVLHRDLKPSNILIDVPGVPHIADFGLARLLKYDGGVTHTRSVLGSPNYMAPEQAVSGATALTTSTDIYGLGAILYEVLTDHPPFQGDSPLETLRLVVEAEAQPPSQKRNGVDPDLETLCLKCLQKDPAHRFQSADELGDELERWLDGRPIHSRPVGWPIRASRWCKRKPALASSLALAILLLLLLAIGSPVIAFRIEKAERSATARLRESLLDQARLLRHSTDLGQRSDGVRLVEQAAALGGTPDFRAKLRDEFLATLVRTEIQFVPQPQWGTISDSALNLIDPKYERHASAVSDSITVRRVSDGTVFRQFSSSSNGVVRLERFSKDGRYLGVRHREGISVWDVELGSIRFATNGPARLFAFTGTPTRLVLDEWPEQIRLIDLENLETRNVVSIDPAEYPENAKGWKTWAASDDGKRLAAGRRDAPVIDIYSLETGRRQRSITNSALVVALAWHPSLPRLGVADEDHWLGLWNVNRGSRAFRMSIQSQARNLTFIGAGNRIAVAGDDRMVRVIDTEAIRTAAVVPADSHAPEFDRSGTRLGPVLRSGTSGWLEMTQPSEFLEANAGDTSNEMTACEFSQDGKVIATRSGPAVAILSAIDLRRIQVLYPRSSGAFALDPSRARLLVVEQNGLFEVVEGEAGATPWAPKQRLYSGPDWRAVSFCPEGGNYVLAGGTNNVAILFDRSDKEIKTLGPHLGVNHVSLSVGSRWLLTGSATTRDMKIWDIESAREIWATSAGPTPRSAFSADGRWLAVSGERFMLLRTGTWEEVPLDFGTRRPLIGAAAFSHNNKLLALVTDLERISLFDISTGRKVAALEAQNPGKKLNAVAFSPDDRSLAAGGNTARLRLWYLDRLRTKLAQLGLDWE